MLLERTHPSGTFVHQLPSGGSSGVFFPCFIVIILAFVAAPHIHLFWIVVSSVQTHCLYCHYHSILVMRMVAMVAAAATLD